MRIPNFDELFKNQFKTPSHKLSIR